jgi:hypothetical protein
MANKMKAWRKQAEEVNREMSVIEGKRVYNKGRMAKFATQMQTRGTGPVAPELLVGLLERGGIRMPKAEAFRDMLMKMKAEHDAKVAAEVASQATEVETTTTTEE